VDLLLHSSQPDVSSSRVPRSDAGSTKRDYVGYNHALGTVVKGGTGGTDFEDPDPWVLTRGLDLRSSLIIKEGTEQSGSSGRADMLLMNVRGSETSLAATALAAQVLGCAVSASSLGDAVGDLEGADHQVRKSVSIGRLASRGSQNGSRPEERIELATSLLRALQQLLLHGLRSFKAGSKSTATLLLWRQWKSAVHAVAVTCNATLQGLGAPDLQRVSSIW
jgi:hypothetical protein